MADSTAPIAAANPELGRLINRAKAVLEMAGGASEGSSLRSRKPRSYDDKKNTILVDLTNLESLLDLLDTGSRPRTDEIRLKQQVRHGLRDLSVSIEDLLVTAKKETANRKSAPSPEVVAERKEDIHVIHDRRAAIKARLAGRRPDAEAGWTGAGGGGGGGMGSVEMSTFGTGGGPGGGASAASAGGIGAADVEYEEEEINDEQRQQLEEVRRLDKEIDRKLEEDMMAVLDDLDNANRGLGEALTEFSQRADDLAQHVDKTKDKIEKVTKNIERVLQVSDGASSRVCSYLICLILLLAVGTIIFNVVTSRSK